MMIARPDMPPAGAPEKMPSSRLGLAHAAPPTSAPRAASRSALERLASALERPLPARVASARELAREAAEGTPATLATALDPLDRLLAGGLPRGRLTELVGRRSSGRFSIALAALAAATASGEAAALVDLGGGLDPQLAAAMGIDLERLLWLRPAHLKPALAGSELLLNAGFPLVVVELGIPPVPGGRGGEAGWLRLARAAETHGATLLVSSPYRASGTAAAAVIEARPARPAWHGVGRAPRLLAGLAPALRLKKLAGRPVDRATRLPLAIDPPPPEGRPRADHAPGSDPRQATTAGGAR